MNLFFNLRSFRARLTLQWTAVFSVVLIMALGGVYFAVRRNLQASLDASLRTLAATEVASAVDNRDEGVHLHDLNNPMLIHEQYVKKFAQILNAEGQVVRQSEDFISREPIVSPANWQAALDGQIVLADVRLNDLNGRAVSLRAMEKGQPYVFVVSVPVRYMEATLTAVFNSLLIAGSLALIATSLIGYRLATVALRPVDLITRRAQVIGASQLRVRLEEPKTDDELSRLAKVLNAMLDRLYAIIESHKRFAADASHELRSPLTSLRSNLEVALRRARSAEQYRAVIESSLVEVERLSKLAEDLLELARADAQRLDLDLSEVELRPLIDEVATSLATQAQARHVTLVVQVPVSLTVIGDENRLRRVLTNLIGNAIHYSPTIGGEVTIAAGIEKEELWLEVRDQGIGMDEDQQAHAFERFWRADRARNTRTGGAGLGLAICQEIVAAHGGTIRIASAPNLGSQFRVSLPVRLDS